MAEPPRDRCPASRGVPRFAPRKLLDAPNTNAPYWRHLRFAAWQEANALRSYIDAPRRHTPLTTDPAVLADRAPRQSDARPDGYWAERKRAQRKRAA